MNLIELKVARIRRGVKARDMAASIGKTLDSYVKKENGSVRITLHEAQMFLKALEKLSLKEFVDIFYDGDIPFKPNGVYQSFEDAKVTSIESIRNRLGYTPLEVAKELRLNSGGYIRREKGEATISIDESAILGKLFGLTVREFNYLFWDGALPYCDDDIVSYSNIIAQKAG